MKSTLNTLKAYLPTLGIILFVGFFIYSTTLYPGGSRTNIDSKGFDWVNNYWCTLFVARAINGQSNPARPFSIVGMIILWASLLLFFFMFANVYSTNHIWKQIIKFTASISIFLASFLFTNLHDFVTTAASIIGLDTIIGIKLGIARSNLKLYKVTGLISILLLESTTTYTIHNNLLILYHLFIKSLL